MEHFDVNKIVAVTFVGHSDNQAVRQTRQSTVVVNIVAFVR